jgi:threonine 3-dehydrogenase
LNIPYLRSTQGEDKKVSVLITGGTGFIGAEVARQLLSARGDMDIYVMHRSENFQRLLDIADQLSFVQADLSNSEQIVEIVKATRPEVIYHLGAVLTGPGEANPQAAVETNVVGTYTLLEAARTYGVRQLLFASSIGVYGADIREDVITDVTLQRPFTIYGISKVFGEQLGAFYKRKYGLDFRGQRYPSIVGPGVKTPSVVQYTSWVIEECAKGNPFIITVTPETAVPIMYYKDAARGIIQLGEATVDEIKTVNYLVDGAKPTPTAGQLADIVRQNVSGAQISFEPDLAFQPMLDKLLRPIDDGRARAEWTWEPTYDLDAIVEDFLAELRDHGERYL